MYKYLPDNEDADVDENISGIDYTGKEGTGETSQLIQKSEIFDVPVNISPQRITLINKLDQGEDEEDPTRHSEPEKIKPRTRLKTNVEHIHIRAYNSGKSNDEYEYQIVLKSQKSGKYDLRFFSMGEDLKEKLTLKTVSLINNQRHFAIGNIIKNIPLTKNVETRFSVKFNALFKYAIKIDLNEIQ